jgi:hypothetical protein
VGIRNVSLETGGPLPQPPRRRAIRPRCLAPVSVLLWHIERQALAYRVAKLAAGTAVGRLVRSQLATVFYGEKGIVLTTVFENREDV